MEVTWEDQQNINKFGRLNNRLHELNDEIKAAKVMPLFFFPFSPNISTFSSFVYIFTVQNWMGERKSDAVLELGSFIFIPISDSVRKLEQFVTSVPIKGSSKLEFL